MSLIEMVFNNQVKECEIESDKLQAEFDNITNEWEVYYTVNCEEETKVKALNQTRTRRLSSFLCGYKIEHEHIAWVLQSYTLFGDKLINSWLRIAKIPKHVIFEYTYAYSHNHGGKLKDESTITEDHLQHLRSLITKRDRNDEEKAKLEKLLPGGWSPLLEHYSNDILVEEIDNIDQYLTKHGSRINKVMHVFRGARTLHGIDEPLKSYMSSTSKNRIDNAYFGKLFVQFSSLSEEEQKNMIDRIPKCKDFDLTDKDCCLFVIRIPANTPFIAMKPVSQRPDEHELLFPRNARFNIKNIAILSGLGRNDVGISNKIVWFVDASW